MYPNLKLQMWRTGIRQNRLAQIVEIDETSLSRIVNGFRKAGPEIRAKISRALASDEAWLFESNEVQLASFDKIPETTAFAAVEPKGSS